MVAYSQDRWWYDNKINSKDDTILLFTLFLLIFFFAFLFFLFLLILPFLLWRLWVLGPVDENLVSHFSLASSTCSRDLSSINGVSISWTPFQGQYSYRHSGSVSLWIWIQLIVTYEQNWQYLVTSPCMVSIVLMFSNEYGFTGGGRTAYVTYLYSTRRNKSRVSRIMIAHTFRFQEIPHTMILPVRCIQFTTPSFPNSR